METLETDAREIIQDALHNADGQRTIDAARGIEERAKALKRLQDDMRSQFGTAFAQPHLDAVQQTLENTADDLRSLDGVRVEALEAGVAGQAMVGQEGTAVVDVQKALQADGSLDMTFAKGVQQHELRHQQQVMASTDILETDAMLYAESRVPGSIKHVSDEYKEIVRRTLARYDAGEVADIAMGRKKEDYVTAA